MGGNRFTVFVASIGETREARVARRDEQRGETEKRERAPLNNVFPSLKQF